jgi:hypothetical protein
MDNLDLAYLEDRVAEIEMRLGMRARPIPAGSQLAPTKGVLRCDMINGYRVEYILDHAGNVVSVANPDHATLLAAHLGKPVPRPEPERPTNYPKLNWDE